jgi:hypothetical protein
MPWETAYGKLRPRERERSELWATLQQALQVCSTCAGHLAHVANLGHRISETPLGVLLYLTTSVTAYAFTADVRTWENDKYL